MKAPEQKRRSSKILPWVYPYWRRVILVLLGLVVTSSITLMVGPGLGWLINAGLFSPDKAVGPALGTVLLWVLVASVIMALGTWIRSYNIAWLGERVAADMRKTVFNHLIQIDPAFFDNQVGTDIQTRFTADTTLLQGVIGSSVSVAARNLVMFVGGLLLMFFLHIEMSIIVIIGALACAYPLYYLGRSIKNQSRTTQVKVASVGAEVESVIQNIKMVQAFNRQKHHISEFRQKVEGAFNSAVKMAKQRSVMVTIVMVAAMASLSALVYYGSSAITNGSLLPGDLVSFIFCTMLVVGSAAMLSEVTSDLARAVGAVSRLDSLLQVETTGAARDVKMPPIEEVVKPLKADSWTPRLNKGLEDQLPETPSLKGKLEVRGLSFSYPSRLEIEVLSDVNLAFEAGSYSAIVGLSGSGKSTLFDLVLRLYEYTQGEIFLDGVELRQIPLEELRKVIGLVRQNAPMVPGSIYDNIAYGDLTAQKEDIEKAAHLAWADEFIRRLPDGWLTKVGDQGKVLSGGQRQRIAIARTLLADPKVLLLDEATSHLDSESEQMVNSALRDISRNRTIIIIAHRLSTALQASSIAVMQSGNVIGWGSHNDLLETCPAYRRIVDLQWSDVGRSELTDNFAVPSQKQV